MATFSIVGRGRAGQSFLAALQDAGWRPVAVLGREDEISGAAQGCDFLLITVPDDAIDDVAAAIEPGRATLVHASGAKGPDALQPHARRASVHPLISLPDVETGRARLRSGIVFAVSGHESAREIVHTLGGRIVPLDDNDRPLYHATAAVAANHLVVIAAQVERLASQVGIPMDAYWDLMETSLANARRLGPPAALTGPAARGDIATLRAHIEALPVGERALYRVLANEAARLAGKPPLLAEDDPDTSQELV